MTKNISKMKEINPDLIAHLRNFLESEARSCSMDPGCITPEYVFRMWGGTVAIEEITEALKVVKTSWC